MKWHLRVNWLIYPTLSQVNYENNHFDMISTTIHHEHDHFVSSFEHLEILNIVHSSIKLGKTITIIPHQASFGNWISFCTHEPQHLGSNHIPLQSLGKSNAIMQVILWHEDGRVPDLENKTWAATSRIRF